MIKDQTKLIHSSCVRRTKTNKIKKPKKKYRVLQNTYKTLVNFSYTQQNNPLQPMVTPNELVKKP